jgi:sugar-specific transcriptional regulator TrmB
MEILQTLTTLWFTENESKVYIASLELWVTQVANISRISGIKRTTLYGILEKMEEKWYLKKHSKNNVFFYEWVDPDILLSELQTNVSKLKEKLPELRAINNKYSNKPKVSLYEWAENVAELYRIEAKDAPKHVSIFSSNVNRREWEVNELRKLRNKIFKEYKDKSKKKLILNREATQWEIGRYSMKTKTIAKDLLNLDISIKIYGNKTHFISMKSPITWVVIENEDIANTMNSIFNYIWKED